MFRLQVDFLFFLFFLISEEVKDAVILLFQKECQIRR